MDEAAGCIVTGQAGFQSKEDPLMKLTSFRARATSLTLALVFALSLMLGVVPSRAAYGQTAAHRMAHHAKNFAQRHRTATSLAAGYAAYKIAKHTGNNRMANGGHKNFMQRHPVLTGVGAAMVTHHMIKKSMKHH
jgi:hypothetical protein